MSANLTQFDLSSCQIGRSAASILDKVKAEAELAKLGEVLVSKFGRKPPPAQESLASRAAKGVMGALSGRGKVAQKKATGKKVTKKDYEDEGLDFDEHFDLDEANDMAGLERDLDEAVDDGDFDQDEADDFLKGRGLKKGKRKGLEPGAAAQARQAVREARRIKKEMKRQMREQKKLERQNQRGQVGARQNSNFNNQYGGDPTFQNQALAQNTAGLAGGGVIPGATNVPGGCTANGGRRALPFLVEGAKARSIAVPINGTEVVTLSGATNGLTTLAADNFQAILTSCRQAVTGKSAKTSNQSAAWAAADLTVTLANTVFGVCITVSAQWQNFSGLPIIFTLVQNGITQKFQVTPRPHASQFFIFTTTDAGGVGTIAQSVNPVVSCLLADNPGHAAAEAFSFSVESMNDRDINQIAPTDYQA